MHADRILVEERLYQIKVVYVTIHMCSLYNVKTVCIEKIHSIQVKIYIRMSSVKLL